MTLLTMASLVAECEASYSPITNDLADDDESKEQNIDQSGKGNPVGVQYSADVESVCLSGSNSKLGH